MRARAVIAAVVLLGLVLAAAYILMPRQRTPVRATLSLGAAMSADTTGFARATSPRPFDFPADHGPHPEFATEWWYFTGNVATRTGRRFGYELSFFRKALAADAPARASAWAADQAYMAHLALTDIAADTMAAFDRFARGAAGLAGARDGRLHVWLHDWKAQGSSIGGFPLRITAAAGEVALDLVLERGKPPVLQGERGLSRKGPEPGNASYYYSLTRMPTRGTIGVRGETFDVQGASWMDREWSTSTLSDGVAGWDWFALQLDDSTELMLYRLRREDGGSTPFSGGAFVRPDGTSRTLGANDFTVDVLRTWESPIDGTRYPAAWQVSVPTLGLRLRVEPVIPDQELNLAVRYWEGAVDVGGTRAGRDVGGVGYVELTGYGEASGRLGYPQRKVNGNSNSNSNSNSKRQ